MTAAERHPRVADAAAAFAALPRQGRRVSIDGVPAVWADGHVQGLARHGDRWIVSVSAPSRDHGLLCVLDAVRRRFVGSHRTPANGLDHPGGIQVCGDYLFVACQKYPSSDRRGAILIYDLARLADGILGDPVNQLALDDFPAGAVGVVDVDEVRAGRGHRHLIVAHDNGRLRWWLSDGRPLRDARFSALASAVSLPDAAAEQVSLIADHDGRVFLITTEAYAEGVTWADKASLWQIELGGTSVVGLTKVGDTRHLKTVHGPVRWGPGVHLRYGGGAQVLPDGALVLHATQMHFIGGSSFALNVFASAPPARPSGGGGGRAPGRGGRPRVRTEIP